MPWKYSDPNEWEFALTQDDFPIEDIALEYSDWVSTDEYSVMKKVETGEIIPLLQSKRGNRAYARRKKHEVRTISEALNDFQFDKSPVDSRIHSSRFTRAIFITLEFDSNNFTIPEAWLALKGVGSQFNLFKSYLNRYFKGKEYKKLSRGRPIISYCSHARKEAHETGYPHIHMILILSQPVPAFWHSKSKSWRLNWNTYVQPIKDAWRDAIGCDSFVDVQPVVGSKILGDDKMSKYNVMSYLMKYVTKDVDIGCRKAVLTHAMQKYFNMRDIFSKSFLTEINALDIRRDTKSNELKQLEADLEAVESQIEEIQSLQDKFGYAVSGKPETLVKLYRRRNEIKDKIRQLMPAPAWEYLGRQTFTSKADFCKWYMPIDKYNMELKQQYVDKLLEKEREQQVGHQSAMINYAS